MIRILVMTATAALFVGCATHESRPMPWAETAKDSSEAPAKTTIKTSSTSSTTTVKSSIVVDQKDIQTLEKMDKALEAFVLKNEPKGFTTLCKDKRFDCYVGDALYPKSKKKTTRKVPPYASGSKMGLQGEQRVQARYDFYP